MGRAGICQVDDCEKRPMARGMCGKHYQRWQKWGDPRFVQSRWRQTDEERFWSKVEKTDECWLWRGGTKNGYGSFWTSRDGADRMHQAHRFAYESAVAPIAPGMTLDHVCHTAVAADCPDGARCPHRACVRPDHMEPMSLSENISIGGNGAKTHCKNGHEFTPENTGSHGSRGQYRYCRTCKRSDGRRFRQLRRTAA